MRVSVLPHFYVEIIKFNGLVHVAAIDVSSSLAQENPFLFRTGHYESDVFFFFFNLFYYYYFFVFVKSPYV